MDKTMRQIVHERIDKIFDTMTVKNVTIDDKKEEYFSRDWAEFEEGSDFAESICTGNDCKPAHGFGKTMEQYEPEHKITIEIEVDELPCEKKTFLVDKKD
jgi:hypothetical protein